MPFISSDMVEQSFREICSSLASIFVKTNLSWSVTALILERVNGYSKFSRVHFTLTLLEISHFDPSLLKLCYLLKLYD